MDELPLGWWTDLQVLRHEGARIDHGPDVIIVRSPDNPGYHWGNFVLFTRPRPAAECRRVVEAAFPGTSRLSVGLCWPPDPAAWSGWQLESNETRLRTSPPSADPTPGIGVRPLVASDWPASVRNGMADGPGGAPFEAFLTARARTRERLVQAGAAAFFGAFDGSDLVAELGIVLCDAGVARYQSVVTMAPYRRRGLASHLLALAGRWAQDRGARRLVIQVEPGSDAQRLYAALGFERVDVAHQAERDVPTTGTEDR